jgi:two-component system sporulation sensor kinase A
MPQDHILKWGISAQHLIKELKEGMLLIEATGGIQYANPAERKRSGFGLKHYRSKNIEELFDVPHQAIILERFHQALQGKRPQPEKVSSFCRNGRLRAVSVHFAPLKGKEGLVILGIVQDLKERIDLENRLQLSFKAIESINDAVLMADEEGRIFYANRASEKITGNPVALLRGKGFTDFLLEGKPLEKIESQMRQGRWSADFNRIQSGGKRFSFKLTVSHLTTSDGLPSGYLVVGKDMTLARQGWEKFYQLRRAWEAERAAQKASQSIQQESYEALLDSVAAGVFLENKNGLVLVNKTFKSLTGHSAASLPSPSFLDLVAYKYKANVEKYFHQVFQERGLSSLFSERCRLQVKGGLQVEVALTLHPLVFKREASIVGTILDASEVMELERKLSDSERLASTGRVAATIVHGFIRPLEHLFPGIQSLKEGPLSRRQRAACRMMEESLERMKQYTNHMISMYEFEHPKKSFVRLHEVLNNALGLIENYLEKNRVTVQLKLSPYVHEILASPHQILQLFVTLVQCSLSSMPSGGRLTISSRRRGSAIIIVFEDTGIGMPEERLQHLFDQIPSIRGAGIGGLGLRAAYDIVKEHQGEIKAESSLGKGTRFVVTLPLSS